MILYLKYESVSQGILYNLFMSREIILLITSCQFRLYPFIHSWFDLCEFTEHWLGVYTAGFTVAKKHRSDLHIVYIALWEMNDERNKQMHCAAGGVTPRNGSQSSRSGQHIEGCAFWALGGVLYDLQERKIKLLIHLSQRQSLPATRRGRTRILWLGIPARFKEWGKKKRSWVMVDLTRWHHLDFLCFCLP